LREKLMRSCTRASNRGKKEILPWILGAVLCSLLCALLAEAACGGGGSQAGTPTPHMPSVPAGSVSHVVLVVLENQNYADVVGSANAPYLNSLMAQGTLATNYYANSHPSMGNYFMMTSGNIVSTDDAYSGTVSPPEIVSALTAAGKNWKVYVEGIPAAGYKGDSTALYLKQHDPLAYFTDVEGTAAANNIAPFPQLATDASGTLATFTMVVPDIYDSAHDCVPAVANCTTAVEVQQADAWLQSTLPQILTNASFAASGLLVVTFDESANDDTNGGGQVATVLLGTNVKAGYQATGMYQHESLLRLMLEAQGVSALPGASATAASMDEVWK
jgi:phosphatidylinositol-3-phosphatase